jgi:1-acyl-sn-glycerol-3-phosphate acyltransferase
VPARERRLRIVRAAYPAVRRLVAPIVGTVYRLEVRGAEHVPPRGGVIVVANHASLIDPLVLMTAIPRTLRFLAKEELWSNRLLGPLLDALGAVPVVRGRGDVAALRRLVGLVEAGEAVGVFPEGGVRSAGGWHRGAARLALETGAPIVPVRLVGTGDALRRGHVGFPRVAVVCGETIPVERARPTIARARALTELVRARVDALA